MIETWLEESLHGGRFRSPIPLGGINPSDPSLFSFEIRQETGPVPDQPPNDAAIACKNLRPGSPYIHYRLDETWQFLFPGFFQASWQTNSQELITKSSDRLPQDVAALLIAGNISASILTMKGYPVLHATCLETGGRTIAFAGPSGTGKTSMATLACLNGAHILSEDTTLVTPTSGSSPGFDAHPGAAILRVRPVHESLAKAMGSTPLETSGDGRLLVRPPRLTQARRLDCILLPRLVETPDPGLKPLSPGEILHLAASFRVPEWTTPKLRTQIFQHACQLFEGLPISWLNWPKEWISGDLPQLRRAAGQLKSLLS